MNSDKKTPITEAVGMKVDKITDFEHDETGLPKSNVLKYELDDGKTYFIIRPSGTEPKIKLYKCRKKTNKGINGITGY